MNALPNELLLVNPASAEKATAVAVDVPVVIVKLLCVAAVGAAFVLAAQYATVPLVRALACKGNTTTPDTRCVHARRNKTILSCVLSAYYVVLAMVLTGSVLSILGFKGGSILAGAGIIGLVVGFGAQAVIRDFVTGITVVSENQISVGDTVEIYFQNKVLVNTGGGAKGRVAEISARCVQLQLDDGSIAFVPWGTISYLVNYSRGAQVVSVDVPLPIGVDVQAATLLLENVCTSLAHDSNAVIAQSLLSRPQVTQVESIDTDVVRPQYTLRIQAKVVPGTQVEIGNHVRLRVLQMLQSLAPHLKLEHLQTETKPSTTPSATPSAKPSLTATPQSKALAAPKAASPMAQPQDVPFVLPAPGTRVELNTSVSI